MPLGRPSLTLSRRARIGDLADDKEVDHDGFAKPAWNEPLRVAQGRPTVVPVQPQLPNYDDAYLPETFFSDGLGALDQFALDARERPARTARHATMKRATAPDSMEYYQSVKLSELQSKAPSWWRPNMVDPIDPSGVAFSFHDPEPNYSRKINVRTHTRGAGDTFGEFVRTQPGDDPQEYVPLGMRPWPAGSI